MRKPGKKARMCAEVVILRVTYTPESMVLEME